MLQGVGKPASNSKVTTEKDVSALAISLSFSFLPWQSQYSVGALQIASHLH